MRIPSSNPSLRLAKALADANRLRIVAALRGGERCVCELCEALGMSQSTLSTHLQVVRGAGLATARREGKWAYYDLTPAGRAAADFYLGAFGGALASERLLRRDAGRLAPRGGTRDGGACAPDTRCCADWRVR